MIEPEKFLARRRQSALCIQGGKQITRQTWRLTYKTSPTVRERFASKHSNVAEMLSFHAFRPSFAVGIAKELEKRCDLTLPSHLHIQFRQSPLPCQAAYCQAD